MTDTIPAGTKVRYHGSMSYRNAYHFDLQSYLPVSDIEFTVVALTPEVPRPDYLSSDEHRYTIVPADPQVMVGYDKMSNYYYNVRRQSITPISGEK